MMNRTTKLQYVREQLRIFEERQRPAANAVLWIMVKLCCGRTEAENLIQAARS